MHLFAVTWSELVGYRLRADSLQLTRQALSKQKKNKRVDTFTKLVYHRHTPSRRFIPGQGSVLQGSLVSPLQFLPPCMGSGLLQLRMRTPLPHDALHADQNDQPPSTMCQGHVKIIESTQPINAHTPHNRVPHIHKQRWDPNANHATPMRTGISY